MSEGLREPDQRTSSGVRVRRVVWLAAVGLLGLCALLLGAVFIYHWNRFRSCEQAIESAQARNATSSLAAAQWDAHPLETFSATQVDEIRRSAERWHQKVDEIVMKGQSSDTTRVYLVGDMVYFVFFGADDRIRTFACVGN